MTKLNLINKHWLNIQCSSCRHDVSVPEQKFIELGVNDIFEVKAKSKCKQCGRKGDAGTGMFSYGAGTFGSGPFGGKKG